MKHEQIASVLMARRNSMAPVLMQGDLQQSLGSEGMAEAMRLRWVQPNYDTGHLQITGDQNAVDTMRKLATESKVEAPLPDAAHSISMSHAGRLRNGQVISEVAAPGTGNAGSSFTPAAPFPPPGKPTAPPTQPVKGGPGGGGPAIGDAVMVAEDGKTFQGKVQSVKQDGKFVISFGSERPRSPRDYDKTEVRMMQAAA